LGLGDKNARELGKLAGNREQDLEGKPKN
jgi:hypothetical protein